MNITQQTTTVSSATQEVLLRTRASDAASIEHGNQIPVAEQMTAHFASAQIDAQPIGTHSHGVRIAIIVFVLLAFVGLVYFVVYPYLTTSAPATI